MLYDVYSIICLLRSVFGTVTRILTSCRLSVDSTPILFCLSALSNSISVTGNQLLNHRIKRIQGRGEGGLFSRELTIENQVRSQEHRML